MDWLMKWSGQLIRMAIFIGFSYLVIHIGIVEFGHEIAV